MALGDPYATSDELKARLGLSSVTSAETARLEGAVSTATQEIDRFCNRQFNSSGSAVERRFQPSSGRVVLTDDFHEEPTLVKSVINWGDGNTEETTVTAFQTEPLEFVRAGFPEPAPKWLIRNFSSQPFSTTGYVLVTAKWGWTTVPTAVKEATLLIAEDYYKLKEAPFGVVNWGEFGPVRVTHNRRAMDLLRQYSRGRVRI